MTAPAGLTALTADPQPGEVVALVGPSGPAWMEAYRGLLARGAVPLLLDHSAPAAELGRWLAAAGGSGRIVDVTVPAARSGVRPVADAGTAGPSAGTPAGGGAAWAPGTVLLSSSGTVGAPKLVPRTVDSLRAEGRRHAEWADLRTNDRVVVPLPLWHAYALGWLHAGVEAGCTVRPLPPTAWSATLREIDEGATVLALVPTVARLLLARAARRGRRATALRVVMVGAGPVDAELDAGFRDTLGIGLARDYGSTETGSLFSAPARAPLGCVGHPLPGVRFRVVPAGDEDREPAPGARVDDEAGAPAGPAGELVVSVDGQPWHRTGDLVSYSPADGLRILGRRSRAIRRADRWVAPDEIEAVLRGHRDVLDARVTAVHRLLRAEVVSLRGTAAGTHLADLRAYTADRLAPHKVPDRITAVGDLPRGRSGKLQPPRPMTLGNPVDLVSAAQGYKRAELLFALLRLGVLDRLRQAPADATTLAADLGLDPDTCDHLLHTAESLGLLVAAPAPAQNPASGTAEDGGAGWSSGGAGGEDAVAVVALEERLSRSWVTRERLIDLTATGLDGRAFDREGPDAGLREAYHRAMHSTGARRRASIGRRLLGERGPLLEITCGPGRYAGSGNFLLRVGVLAGEDPTPCRPPDGTRVDRLVVCNAVHQPGPGSDLRGLASRLTPGGRLLVDDVFLGVPSGLPPDIRLDWLTHGGSAWPTEAGLTAGLTAAGFTVRRTLHVGTPAVTLLLATAP